MVKARPILWIFAQIFGATVPMACVQNVTNFTKSVALQQFIFSWKYSKAKCTYSFLFKRTNGINEFSNVKISLGGKKTCGIIIYKLEGNCNLLRTHRRTHSKCQHPSPLTLFSYPARLSSIILCCIFSLHFYASQSRGKYLSPS